jgi:hypothetical protein
MASKMSRYLFGLALAFLACSSQAAPGSVVLCGRVQDRFYYGPHGNYRVPIPVLLELGGFITDTEDSVEFQDDYNTYFTINSIPLDAAGRLDLGLWGIKGYLAYFFNTQVAPAFHND